MPIAYHVDRCHALKENTILELDKEPVINTNPIVSKDILATFFPDGISYHGKKYLSDFCYYLNVSLPISTLPPISNEVSIHILEFQLELLRRSLCPNIPSRYQSFFALENLEDLKLWPELDIENSHIFEIEYQDSTKLDASQLHGGISCCPHTGDNKNSIIYGFSSIINLQQLIKYWSVENSDNPKFELLLPFPIKVGKRIM